MRASFLPGLVVALLLAAPGCSETEPEPAQEAPAAASPIVSVTIVGAPTRIDVGASASLSAVVVDGDGVERSDVTVSWSTSSETALVPSRDGTVSAVRAGLHVVTAAVGAVQSASVVIQVVEPGAEEEATARIRVELPEWAAGRTFGLLEPGTQGLRAIGAEPETIAMLRRQNRMLVLADTETEQPVLLAMVGGATDTTPAEGQDEPLTVDLRTTAEALLFVQAGFPVTSPEALAALREFHSHGDEVTRVRDVLAHWTRGGGSWVAHFAEVLPELQDAGRRLNERLNRLRPVGSEEAEGGKADEALRVTVIPELPQSGIVVEFWPCDDPPVPNLQNLGLIEECESLPADRIGRTAMLNLKNNHARYVFAYLETDGGAVVAGPIPLSGITYVGSFWETFFSAAGDVRHPGATGDPDGNGMGTVGASTFISPASTHRLVDFDPDAGGGIYRLLVYGPGAFPSTIPAAYSDWEETLERSIVPWILTAWLSYGANILAAVLGMDSYTTGIVANTVVDCLNGLFNPGQEPLGTTNTVLGLTTEAYDTVLTDAGTAGMTALVLSALFGKILSALKLTGAIAADTLENIAIVPLIWDIVGGTVNAVMVLVDFFYSDRGSMFTLRGLNGGAVDPLDRILPAAEAGCAWEVEFTLLFPDTQFDHTWTFSSAYNPQGGWMYQWTGLYNDHFRVWRNADSPMSEADAADGQARVTVGVSPVRDGVAQQPLDHGEYTFYVGPDAPRVVSLQLSDALDGVLPGAEVGVRVEARRCGSTDRVTSGTIDGEVLAAPATLVKAADGWLEGTLEIAEVAVDGPGHTVQVAVTADDGTQATVTRELVIANVPPELLPAGVTAAPGGEVAITLTVRDANFDGNLLSEIPASGVSLGDAEGLSVTPALSEVAFQWAPELSTPAQGLLALRGEPTLQVASPHPDNDGTNGLDGSPILVAVSLVDASGAQASEAYVEVTVLNVAPHILNGDTVITIAEDPPPPSTFVLRVTDENGLDDIAAPIIEGANPGFLVDSAQTVDGERQYTYLLDHTSLAAACDPYCEVVFRAKDKDDLPSNGGLSEPLVVVVSLGELYPCGSGLPPCPAECTEDETLLERTCQEETGLCSAPVVTDDCAAKGEVCRDSACRAPCLVATDCTDTGLDTSCADPSTLVSWACPEGGCIPSPTVCSESGQICAGATCTDPCASNDDCPPGCTAAAVAQTFSCVLATGQCALETETPCDPLACSAGACYEACPNGPGECPPPFCFSAAERVFWTCDGGLCLQQSADCAADGLTCSDEIADCTDKCVGPESCPSVCTVGGEVASFECAPSGLCESLAETPCEGALTCVGGACVLPCGPGAPCPPAECVGAPAGGQLARTWTCEAGFCAASDLACGDAGCLAGSCVTACAEDADCPPTCEGPIRSVWECAGGACALVSSEPCPSGTACVVDECLLECADVADCPAGGAPACTGAHTLATHTCAGGFCVPAQVVCLDDLVCSPAEADCVPPCEGTCPDLCNAEKDGLIHRSCLESGVCELGSEAPCPDVKPACVDGECRLPCDTDADCVAGLGAPTCEPPDLLVARVCAASGYCEDKAEDCTKSGAQCVVNACVPIDCAADGDCPGWCTAGGEHVSQSCVDGACAPGEPAACSAGQICTPGGCAIGCAADADCPDGWTCVDDDPSASGHCRECTLDTDCPDEGAPYCSSDLTQVLRLRCVAYTCTEEVEADCAAAESSCESGACLVPACEGDSDCAEGDLCVHAGTLDAVCVECVEDFHCAGDCFGAQFRDAHCVEGVCKLDESFTQCPAGQACIDQGVCGALCGPDEPCPDGQTCLEEGTVVDYCAECASKADCEGGEAPTACDGDQVVKVECIASLCKTWELEDCQAIGQVCVAGAGACGPKSCQSDGDCAAPLVCAGLDSPSPFCAECREAFHCPEPECTEAGVVRGSTCTAAGTCEPADLADCKAMGFECVAGSCGSEVSGCCTAHAGPGCEESGCESCVCAPDQAPECCEEGGAWGYECLAVAVGECAAQCQCESPCCEDHPEAPGCSDEVCQSCVCGVDDTCCSEGWHAGCDTVAATICQGICGCAGSACTPHAAPGANDPKCAECVCYGAGQDPGCCLTEWGYLCTEAARVACAEDCGCAAPCCEAHPGHGCELGACETCVCDLAPGCCNGEWTPECAALATAACAPVCACPGECCGDHAAPGCNAIDCQRCVCETAGSESCCLDEWTADCHQVAQAACFSECGCPEGCCYAHDSFGCDDATCSGCVCDQMPACCEVAWAPECAELARTGCVADCGCVGTCCEPHVAAKGCDETACESDVCAEEPGCCEEAWTEACSAIAQKSCLECAECFSDEGCDDAIACTVDTCVDNVCVHTPDHAACDDTLACTTDTCTTDAGCFLEATGTPCCKDDAHVILPECDAGACVPVVVEDCSASGETCVGGECSSVCATPCDDANPCTVDTCEGGECVSTPDDSACDDSNACTIDTCAPGGCESSLACDDGDPCTADVCFPQGAGCVHGSDGLPCCKDGKSYSRTLCERWGGEIVCGSKEVEDCGALGFECVDGQCQECFVAADCPGGGEPVCGPGGSTSYTCWAGRCVGQEVLPGELVVGAEVDALMLDAPSKYYNMHGVLSTEDLECATYCVWVEGTFSYWNKAAWNEPCQGEGEAEPMYPSPDTINGPTGIDPRYIFAYPQSASWCDEGMEVPSPHDYVRYRTDGLAPNVTGGWEIPEWKTPAGYDKSHRYGFEVVGPAPGLAVGLAVSSAHYGMLSIVIEAGPCVPAATPAPPPPSEINAVVALAEGPVAGKLGVLPGMEETIAGRGSPVLTLFKGSETRYEPPAAGFYQGLVKLELLQGWSSTTLRSLLGYHEGTGELRDATVLGLRYLEPGPTTFRVTAKNTSISIGSLGAQRSLHLLELGHGLGPMPTWAEEGIADPLAVDGWTDLDGLDQSIVTGGGPLWIALKGTAVSVTGTPTGRARLRLLVDGEVRALSVHDFHNDGDEEHDVLLLWLEPLSAGYHEIAVQWARGTSIAAGAGTLDADRIQLTMAELRGLGAPLLAWQTAASDTISTPAGPASPMPGAALTFTTPGAGPALVLFGAGGCEITGTTAGAGAFALEVDGEVRGGWHHQTFHHDGQELRDVTLVESLTLAAGAHTARVLWRSDQGQLSVSAAGATRALQVISLRDTAFDNLPDCDDNDPCTEDAWDPWVGCVHASDGLPCCSAGVSVLASCTADACTSTPLEDCAAIGLPCIEGRCVECATDADCPSGGEPVCEPAGWATYRCVRARCRREVHVPDPLELWEEVGDITLGAASAASDPIHALAMETPLAECVSYCVWVEGTYSPWAAAAWSTSCDTTPEPEPMYPSEGSENGPVGLDAGYVFAYPAETAACASALAVPVAHDAFRYRLDGQVEHTADLEGWLEPSWTPWTDEGYEPYHYYSFDVVGAATPLSLGLAESGTGYGDLYAYAETGPCQYSEPPDFDPLRIRNTLRLSKSKASTSSSTFEPLPGLQGGLLTTGEPWLLLGHMPETQLVSDSPSTASVRLLVDEVERARSVHGFHTAGWELRDVSLLSLETLAEGQHQLRVDWQADAGELTTGWESAWRKLIGVGLGHAEGPMPTWKSQHADTVATTSDAWSEVPQMSLRLVSGGGPVWILFVGAGTSITGTTTGRVRFRLLVDGTLKATTTLDFHNDGADARDAALYWLETLPAGAHDVRVEWARGGAGIEGEGTVSMGASRSLIAAELRGTKGGLDAWQVASAEPVTTTAGGTWVVIPGMELNFSTAVQGTALLLFKTGGTQVSGVTQGQVAFTLEIDGQLIKGYWQKFHHDGGELRDVTLMRTHSLAAGPHVARVRWWRSGAGLPTTSATGATRVLQVISLIDPGLVE